MTQPFRMGPWTIEPPLHRICGDDVEARVVSHKVMAVLVCLASRPGEVVRKEELIERVWEGAFTSDESLTTVIYELRKALNDSARRPRFIETIRKGGYRLMAEVEPLTVAEATSSPRGPVAVDRPVAVSPGTTDGPEAVSALGGIETPDASEPPAPAAPLRGLNRRALMSTGLAALLVAVVIAGSVGRSPAPEAAAEPVSMPIEAAETAPRLASLAVLPLHSFGETCGEDGFAGGLTEMLVVDLAEAVPLEVLPSLATRTLNQPWSLGAVTSELEADLVIEGSVIRSGERLWLSVQLVDTASGRLLWGGSYERQVEDALLIQRDLAGSITDEVRRIVVEAASTAAASERPEGWRPQGVPAPTPGV